MSAAIDPTPPAGLAPITTSRRTTLLVALVAMLAHIPVIWVYRPPIFYDDAMFFFRYAEHLAMGEGFRYNLGEPPIWGASAPLWPMLLAGLVRCGLSPEVSSLVFGWILGLTGAGALGVAALRCAGLSGAAWCIVFQAFNWRFGSSVLSGMESPLAMWIVSFGILALSGRAAWWSIGALAGLAMAEKIDMAPFGLFLLAGAWLRTGQIPWRATLVAGLIAGAWYLFALVHFGSVVPNSFVTKLHADYAQVQRDWFLIIGFLEGGRLATTMAAMLAPAALWHRKELLLACFGLMFVMLAGYTLRPPAEDFGWYQAPHQPALCLMAGVGVGAAMESLMRRALIPTGYRLLLQGVAMAIIASVSVQKDLFFFRLANTMLTHTDGDRMLAGKWIDAHTPKDARLLTGYGHIAYYAHRYTIDEFCLNRRAQPQPTADIIAATNPEILGMCQFRTGVPPEKYTPPAGYRLVKIFDRTYRNGVADFYVAVMLRQDVPQVGGD